MVKDAETNATSDKAKREAIDTKNNVRPTSLLIHKGTVVHADAACFVLPAADCLCPILVQLWALRGSVLGIVNSHVIC